MTRKKSNVKALALAVTCAILAGGGIGLEPVYAAANDVTYNSADSILKYEAASTSGGSTTTPTEIQMLVVNGVTIGSANGEINASKIVGTGTDTSVEINGVKISDVSTGSVTMHNIGGAITISGMSTAMYDVNIGNDLKVTGKIIDPNDVSKAVSVADLANAVGQVETNRINIINNQNDIAGLKTKTTGISYSTATGTTVDGVQLKEKGISAAGGAFTVNGTDGETVVSGTGGKTTINNSSIVIEDTTSSKHVIITNEDVNASHSVQAKIIDSNMTARMADGNVVAKNGLYVGAANITAPTKDNSKFSVDGTTGDTAVGGNLSVAGTTTFTGETTFDSGIKTNTISGKNPDDAVTVNGNIITTDKKFNGVELNGGNVKATDITAAGALKGQTLGIGAGNDKFTVDENGNTNVGGTLGVTGATTLENALDVKGATTLKDKLQVDGIATFGSATGSQTVITGDQVETGRIDTKRNQASNIGGVQLHNGQITADSMTIKGNIDLENLKVKNELTVGANTKITEGTLQLGTVDDNRLTADKLANINQTIKSGKVIEANSATIGGVGINGGNVTATGTIQGNIISDNGGATLTGGKITANEGKIGNVEIKASVVSGVTRIEAQAFKVDDDNYLNSTGIKANSITAKGGTIGGAVIDATTLTVGVTKLDSVEGITTHQLKIRDMTLTDKGLNTGDNEFEVNGVKLKQGQVTAVDDKGFVVGTSSFKKGSLIVDANNKLEANNGLTTQKATVTGTLDVTGQATFGTGSDQTTINGKNVTTDTLRANTLILGASGTTTVVVDKDGSLKAAGGKFEVDKDGALKAANGAFYVDKDGKTTFTKDAKNLSSINGGNIWAKATDDAAHTSSELNHTYKGLHVSGTQAGKTSAFDFDTSTGIGTFTGQDETTTTINGSNLILVNGANKTELTAGGVTFTGTKGASAQEGKTTTINGGIITTDTLNVQRIELGEKLVDKNGDEFGSNLSMDNQGNFTAAGGNFKVTGGTEGSRGSITNVVGDDTNGKTSFETNQQGAKMRFKKGEVTSNVSVADGSANVSAGAGSIDVTNESITSKVTDNATSTITKDSIVDKVGNNSVTTDDKGTTFANGGTKTTNINGGTITTGKLITDELVITGKGDAAGPGTGSLAFGGNGTIKSDVKEDGSTNNTQFTTDINGVNTMVTDGKITATTTENKVTAEGNSNTVTKGDQKSEFNQGLTSIGGVVTNGEIKVAQYLDGEKGLLTNEVKDAKGSSMLVQNGSGLEYTDSANDKNATRINSSDVSIGSATNDKDRINLSDLGQIDELDQEIRDNEVYKKNETAVGGINAEAAIRREEVARLDGRINDVNDRVNKVGAMAAAIASLKSIGYDPQAPSEFSIGLGQYKGETGVAMGFFHYPNKNFMINVSLSTAGGETMGGIGATWRFGHKSPQKLLEEQREAQAKKELAAAEKYQAAAKLAKEAQERAEYAAKLARQAQVSADNAKAAADATQAKHFG